MLNIEILPEWENVSHCVKHFEQPLGGGGGHCINVVHLFSHFASTPLHFT